MLLLENRFGLLKDYLLAVLVTEPTRKQLNHRLVLLQMYDLKRSLLYCVSIT